MPVYVCGLIVVNILADLLVDFGVSGARFSLFQKKFDRIKTNNNNHIGLKQNDNI